MVCFPRSKQILFRDVIRILFISSGETVVPPYRRPQRAGHRQTLLPQSVQWLLGGTAWGQGCQPCTARSLLPCACSPHSPPHAAGAAGSASVQVPSEPRGPGGTHSLSGATLYSPDPLKTNYYQPRQKVNTSNISLSLWTHGNPIHLSLSFNPSQQGAEKNSQHWGLPRQGVLVGSPVLFPHPSHPEPGTSSHMESVPGAGGNPRQENSSGDRGLWEEQAGLVGTGQRVPLCSKPRWR